MLPNRPLIDSGVGHRELIADTIASTLGTRSLGEAKLDNDRRLEHRVKLLETQVHRLQQSLQEMSEKVQRLLKAQQR